MKKDTLAKLESCADYLGSTVYLISFFFLFSKFFKISFSFRNQKEYLNFAHKQEAEYKTMVEVFSYYLDEYD